MTLYPKLITDALEKVIYPGTKKNIIESEMLADTPSINGNKVSIIKHMKTISMLQRGKLWSL